MTFRLSGRRKKVILKLLLIFSLSKAVWYVYSIFQAYHGLSNPLIPDYLANFIAFPLYFLIADWLVISYLSWKLIRKEELLRTWFYHVFIGSLVYLFIGQALVYQLLQQINPYG